MHQGDQGTVFAGTTISNSLRDLHLNYTCVLLKWEVGYDNADAWAEVTLLYTAELEYGVTSELKEKDRFAH